MQSVSPVNCNELLQLTNLGISQGNISFSSITMESEKYICVREKAGDGAQIVIVDVNNPTNVIRKSISATSAIMNPLKQILGLKAGRTLQLFNLEQKIRMKVHELSEESGFWKWLSPEVVGIVTQSSTYGWSITGISGQPGAKVAGTLQLYSVDKKVSQILEGHVATFFRFQLSTASKPSLFFSFATRNQTGGKADERLGLIFFLTKYGCLYIQEVESAQTIFQNRISQQPIFLTCPQSSTNGFLGISRSGQVLSISVNDAGIIQHVKTAINNPDVAISLSSRMNQPGMADDLFVYKFNQLFAEGKYSEAVIVAAKAPGQILRNAQTIQRFQHIQPMQNQPSPLLKYFTYLLDTDKLNKHESVELCKVVFQQNRKSLVEKWLKEDKLECSEELGDLVRSYDSKIALSVYLRANVPNKVIELFAENGQHQNILPYAQKVGYSADYTAIVRNLFKSNPEQATQFALNLLQGEEKLADLNNLVQVFMESQNLPQITRFLLEALKNNLPEEAQFQNRLLELNLMHAPQVADTILGNKMFSHYDKQNIARLCERAGLFQRALENYTDIYDIKRALMNVTSFNPDFLVEFFGNLSVSDAMDCLQSMLHINLRQNLQLVIQIASTYHELLGVNNIIHMLESYKTSEGLFVCNENALFKIEARYLLRLKDPNIWRTVLSDKNEHRRALIDQIVQTALPESQSAEDISVAVRSFLEADLTNELIELLEKIVLENTMFSEHTNLQNLLILTALRSSKANVSSYLEKLDKYDAPEIARKMIDSGRFEDAFNIYSKFGDNNMAIMVDMIKDFERALDFAEKINEPTVWATLGRAQLRDPELVKLGLSSYLKSGEVADYMTVIDTVIALDSYWDDFVKFILMVRKTIRNRTTDDALILAYAKCDRLNELEEFIQISSNHADINRVCFACIDNNEFRLAKVAALNIVIHADSLQEVILYYEDKGYFTELLDMMESSVSLERTHMGIFTELAILFIKYSPLKTKEHVEMFWSRMNVPKVLRAAEQAHLWYELIFLYEKYEEYDNAASTFIAHPSVGYRDIQIKEILIKVVLMYLMSSVPELLSVVQTKPNAQYDKLELAKQLQAHDLKQFRNISSYLMRQSNRFVDSVEICKRDELYAQAIVHVSESNDPELAYSLVRFFLDKNLFSYFSAILYHCYSLFSADRVLEYAWRFNVKKLEEKDTVRTEKEDAKSGEFVPMIGRVHVYEFIDKCRIMLFPNVRRYVRRPEKCRNEKKYSSETVKFSPNILNSKVSVTIHPIKQFSFRPKLSLNIMNYVEYNKYPNDFNENQKRTLRQKCQNLKLINGELILALNGNFRTAVCFFQESKINSILTKEHFIGHPGVSKMCHLTSQKYIGINQKVIRHFISTCDSCNHFNSL
ncbi:clathrin heavy chain 1-like [Octopus sinensis]|uniref:Clathrin heavy chain n=1 Tax=Octopus sinensis TaxID=2607531 RepID=A0A6P7TQB6_9MOLL|nr:clathrin heavy chain 1-like [Octopus sinensis]